jgi:hypothetical protein
MARSVRLYRRGNGWLSNDKEHDMRTWKCVGYGHTQEVDYDQLAEHGKPKCGVCGCRMELQPEVDLAVVERLAEKADSAGLQPEDLDEMVHELASSIASDVNNEGVDGQVKYLVKEMGAQHAEKQLDELIEERQRKAE